LRAAVDPRSRLVALAATVDARSLAEGALWIAAEAHPGLDVPHWLGRIDALGYRVAERLALGIDGGRAAAARTRVPFRGGRVPGQRGGLLRPPQQLSR